MSALADLTKEIEVAFAAVDYPGDHNITYDQSGYHQECAEVAEHFRGKHWRELAASETSFLYLNSIGALTPEAHAFFLPAYLLACLRVLEKGPAEDPWGLVDAIVVSLTREVRGDDNFEAIAGALNAPQRKVIAKFLEYLEGDSAVSSHLRLPSVALEQYWKRYLNPA